KTGEVQASELYDHREDPMEMKNVAAQAENASVVERLGAMLAEGWGGALPEQAVKQEDYEKERKHKRTELFYDHPRSASPYAYHFIAARGRGRSFTLGLKKAVSPVP